MQLGFITVFNSSPRLDSISLVKNYSVHSADHQQKLCLEKIKLEPRNPQVRPVSLFSILKLGWYEERGSCVGETGSAPVALVQGGQQQPPSLQPETRRSDLNWAIASLHPTMIQLGSPLLAVAQQLPVLASLTLRVEMSSLAPTKHAYITQLAS